MGKLIYFVSDQIPNHMSGTTSVKQQRLTHADTVKDKVEYLEGSKLYYKSYSLLFFFGGLFVYVIAAYAAIVWEQMWTVTACIFFGGGSWVLGVICLHNLERHRNLLRHFSHMGHQTSED